MTLFSRTSSVARHFVGYVSYNFRFLYLWAVNVKQGLTHELSHLCCITRRRDILTAELSSIYNSLSQNKQR